MKRALSTALLLFGVLVAAPGQLAADLIPTPDFSDHKIPLANPPEPPPGWYEWADVAALVVALSLASYLAVVQRSRKGLFLLAIASLAWFGFWRQGCVCSIGATQNVALALFDSRYVIPVSVVIFFTLPLVVALFFGRTFCASVCPLGAMQEMVAIRSIRVPKWVDHSLGLVPYFYLGVAVAFAATNTAMLICRYDPFVGFFRLSGSINMLVFGGCLLVIGVFIGRPYCRYLCPYGAILGVLSRFSKWHLRIPPKDCIQCRLCADVCPYDAIWPPTVDQPASKRPAARLNLAVTLIAFPLLILAGLVIGRQLSVPLSRLDHTVRLAERVEAEVAEEVEGTTDASDAFWNEGRPVNELVEEAMTLRAKYAQLGGWIGAWFGFVIGVKMIHLSIRRRRTEYSPDRGACVSCGRCFWYCPPEQVRLGLIEDVSEMVDVSQLPTVTNTKPE